MSCTNYDDATVTKISREISIIDIVVGFLCYQLPIHVCLSTRHKIGIDLTFSMGDVLLELAGCVHSVVALYPANLVEQTEKRELISEPAKNMSAYCKLRGFLHVHVLPTVSTVRAVCVCVCNRFTQSVPGIWPAFSKWWLFSILNLISTHKFAF